MNRSHSGSSEIRDDAAQQFEIDLPVGRQIEFPGSPKVNIALPDNVSSLAHQMRLFQPNSLFGVGKTDGILVVQFGVLDVKANIRHVAVERPLPRLT